ncbi:phospholipase D family protein [Mycoplana rhizolycopersici]|uniref:Phospholipase D n=1 Tax=Mycoplana rhizolycopersici TaxID=2746702 RepID=A0ABX2QI60_9HYPH|nr:phospholipase D family protein [Rhizobium rhizolycopersici]NVP56056.1 hypothetical protein [Rhizobium rhizolycopersici]
MRFFFLWLAALHCTLSPREASADNMQNEVETTIAVGMNRPLCGPYSYGNGLPNITSFCSDADLSKNLRQNALQLFEATVKHKTATEITYAFWAFSHQGWGEQLCKMMTQRTLSVRGAIDRGRERPRDQRVPNDVVGCAYQNGVRKIELSLLGQEGDFLEFHPKFVTARFEDGTAVTLVSSGNPTRNSEYNFDVSILFKETTPGSTPIHDWHQCAFGAFTDEDGKPITSYTDAARRYYKCAASLDAGTSIGVTQFLLPFDRSKLTNRISFLLGGSSRVSVAVQSADSLLLRDMFLQATKRGTAFRVLRDDDLLYVGASTSGARSGDGEFMNRQYERDVWLRPLIDAGAEVRYLATNNLDNSNPNAKLLGNFLHLKIIVFEAEGRSPTILVGSANLTDAAFGHNVENVYLVENPVVVKSLLASFDQVWLDGRSQADLPLQNERPK